MPTNQHSTGNMQSLPLTGLVVLELGTIIAGPFCGSLLAELGATVIKIESPTGDGLRKMGPQLDNDSIWWGVSSRNKRCISLDLKNPSGRLLLQDLIKKAHVLTENYRPGVLEKLGFPESTLRDLNPDLVVLRISGYGQDGPWAPKPGFGKIAEGLSGVADITGKNAGPPVFMGFSLADTSSGLFGAFGTIVALLGAETKTPKMVDVALYEPLMRILETKFNLPESRRRGTNNPLGWGVCTTVKNVFLHTYDNEWLQIEYNDATPSLMQQPWCTSVNSDHTWFETTLTTEQAKRELAALTLNYFDVVDGYTALNSEYFRQRADVVIHHHENGKTLGMPGFVPKQYNRDNFLRFRSPRIGEDNHWVASNMLELDDESFAALMEQGAFGAHLTHHYQPGDRNV